MTCSSDCTNATPTAFPNCRQCSTTACTDCQNGFFLTSGQCTLPCASLANCVSCLSSTQCASCAKGYLVSADLNSCELICKSRGCKTCASATTTDCTAC